MNKSRFLLCRPKGGLNDVLCQIEKCRKYSLAHNRILVVDTNNYCFFSDFDGFFEFIDSSNMLFGKIDYKTTKLLDHLSCHPSEVEGIISTYKSRYSSLEESGIRNWVETDSRAQLSFDFDSEYDQDLLVHDQSGGGDDSFELCRQLTLSPELKRITIERISQLSSDYLSVHVRNTDYQTDYKSFFEKISDKLENKNVLICSDDSSVIDYAHTKFINSNVFSSSDIPSDCRPRHKNKSEAGAEEDFLNASNSIVDLVALARGKELHFSNVTAGFPSGFSRLATFLHNNPDIVEQWLYFRQP